MQSARRVLAPVNRQVFLCKQQVSYLITSDKLSIPLLFLFPYYYVGTHECELLVAKKAISRSKFQVVLSNGRTRRSVSIAYANTIIQCLTILTEVNRLSAVDEKELEPRHGSSVVILERHPLPRRFRASIVSSPRLFRRATT